MKRLAGWNWATASTNGRNKTARSFMQGDAPEPIRTLQTDAEMLADACGKLLNFDRVNVIDDEAHHCYRHKVGGDAEGVLTGDEKREAAENEAAARLWINGIEALDRKLSKGVRAVYDLSAMPFFLRGSGYPEGYLFPWVACDFSLMDAIESGIVKRPRVPVTDNLAGTDTVVYRDLWKHIGKGLPKTAAGANKLSPFDLPNMLLTALNALYSHYAGEFERWRGGRASACRRRSSSSARIRPFPSWCSNGSPASSGAQGERAGSVRGSVLWGLHRIKLGRPALVGGNDPYPLACDSGNTENRPREDMGAFVRAARRALQGP